MPRITASWWAQYDGFHCRWSTSLLDFQNPKGFDQSKWRHLATNVWFKICHVYGDFWKCILPCIFFHLPTSLLSISHTLHSRRAIWTSMSGRNVQWSWYLVTSSWQVNLFLLCVCVCVCVCVRVCFQNNPGKRHLYTSDFFGLLGKWGVLLYGGVHVLQSALIVCGQQPRGMARTCAWEDDVQGHT